MKEAIKLVANNKKAYHDYFIDEKFECGIELFGTEVKSIRMGKCSVKEAFVRIDKNEVYIYGMHINPYEKGNIFNKDPLRARKLLMHRSDIHFGSAFRPLAAGLSASSFRLRSVSSRFRDSST